MSSAERGQAELVGTVLLVAVFVVAVSVVGFFLLDSQAARIDNTAPNAEFRTSVSGDSLTLTHMGGETFLLDNLNLLLETESDERTYNLGTPSDLESSSTDGDGRFEPAESVTVSHSFTGDIRILLVDRSAQGYLLYDETKTVPSPTPTPTPTPTPAGTPTPTATPTPTPASTATPTPVPASFDVTIDSTNSPVTSGETATVTATIDNTGEQQATQTIELDVEGQNNPVDTEQVTLAGGGSTTVTLEWTTENNDHTGSPYTATARSDDDSEETEITVENPGGPP